MKNTRRTFLKIAGLSLLGVGAKPVWDALARAEEAKIIQAPEALKARRWAMVINLKKKCPESCRDCIEACHTIHNVPDFGNAKD